MTHTENKISMQVARLLAALSESTGMCPEQAKIEAMIRNMTKAFALVHQEIDSHFGQKLTSEESLEMVSHMIDLLAMNIVSQMETKPDHLPEARSLVRTIFVSKAFEVEVDLQNPNLNTLLKAYELEQVGYPNRMSTLDKLLLDCERFDFQPVHPAIASGVVTLRDSASFDFYTDQDRDGQHHLNKYRHDLPRKSKNALDAPAEE